ncbi:MAG: RnfABCDGE type electron transport complex subunit G [Pseudomonadota bacterium]
MSADIKRTSVVGGTLKLTAFAAFAALIVAASWQLTHERIEQNLHTARMAQFATVLSGVAFDRIDYDNPELVSPPHTLPGSTREVRIYRVYQNDAIVAWVFNVYAAGYSGPIELMVGIDRRQQVTAVRVLSHTETPGLGDDIERSKSDWIASFNNQALGDDQADWALRKDGGRFDAFTGASITPRAVVIAVRDTLRYAERYEETLIMEPSE